VILPLDHTNELIAHKIYSVFQASYAVEAQILKAVNFPPLQRTVPHFLSSTTSFYGAWEDTALSGVVEILSEGQKTHIQSLVVHPDHFRKGIGRGLVVYVLQRYSSQIYTVETGVDNGPAIALYQNFDFKEIHQWDTDHGIRKIRLERIS